MGDSSSLSQKLKWTPVANILKSCFESNAQSTSKVDFWVPVFFSVDDAHVSIPVIFRRYVA